MHGGLLFESDDERGAVGDRLDAQGHDYGVEHAVPAGGTVGLHYDALVPAAADSLEAAVLVSKFHFRRHERERFGILELHSSFQTESRYHDAQAAALHDASDVAALNAPAQIVTVLHFVNEERRRPGIRRTFCPRSSAGHTCRRRVSSTRKGGAAARASAHW